ncbi:hypothetical protein GW17_00028270 [Ensete ventricosum]|nr:hypothetical protein GW17_00028270 [Ensete ventricosum]RZS10669.1 hypothetical protein BHM03_00041918 [Ensete ventricosum]
MDEILGSRFSGLVDESTRVCARLLLWEAFSPGCCELSSSGMSSLSDCVESTDSMRSEEHQHQHRHRQHRIPPQVLVPLSLKSSSTFGLIGDGREGGESQDKSFGFVIPEGRVHGGTVVA